MFAPSNISPEFLTLDLANYPQVFSWTNNNMSQYAFRIYFYDNTNDALLFDTTQQISSATIYTLSAGSIANNKEIKYFIRQWINISTYVDSEYILIKSAIKPVVTIPTTPINTQSFYFTANVTLAPNTSIQKYRFILYDNFNSIVDDSDYIFGYVPQYTFNGLISGLPYKIKAIVYDQNSQNGESSLVTFTTTYTSPSPVSLFTVTSVDDQGAVKIDFSQINQTKGTLFGTGSYVDGKFSLGLSLNKNSYVEFIKTIPITFTYTYYVKLPTDFNGDIVRFGNNEYAIFYDGKKFGYRFDNYITCGRNRALPSDEFIKIAFKYGKVIIQTLSYTEIIF